MNDDNDKDKTVIIKSSDVAPVKIPEGTPIDNKVAQRENDLFKHEENKQRNTLGWLGRIWGAKIEKPGNISGLIAIVIVLYMGYHIFQNLGEPAFNDVLYPLTGILTLILGYLFGSSDKS